MKNQYDFSVHNNLFPNRGALCLLLGLPFDAVTIEAAAEKVLHSIDKQARCFLSTPNINFTIAASNDLTFYRSVAMSDLSIADGMPLVWLAKILGLPIQERVAGSDLFEYLSKRHTDKPVRVFFFGGEAGVAEKAHRQLNMTAKGIVSVGYHDPGFVTVDEMSSQETIDKINEANADFLLVALGAKKGQSWIVENMEHLNVPVISHLGAVVNFVAGNIERAPQKWQSYGLEWLWRIKQEPMLWKRYFFDAISLVRLVFSRLIPYHIYSTWLKTKSKNNNSSINVVGKVISVTGVIDESVTRQLTLAIKPLMSKENSSIQFDFSDVSYMDNAAIAYLVILQGLLSRNKGELILHGISVRIKRLFHFAGVLNYLDH